MRTNSRALECACLRDIVGEVVGPGLIATQASIGADPKIARAIRVERKHRIRDERARIVWIAAVMSHPTGLRIDHIETMSLALTAAVTAIE